MRLATPLLLALATAATWAGTSCTSAPPAEAPPSTPPTGASAPPVPGDVSEAIDAALTAEWAARSIEPARPADDATWLRRVTLDVLGRVPTEDEVLAHLADRSPDRDARLVDRLLADPAHATRLARWWEDVLLGPEVRRGDVDRGALRRWLAARFARDDGWDTMVRGLVTAEGTSSAGGRRLDRLAGPDAERTALEEEREVDGAVNWLLRHRKSRPDLAGAAAQAFLGVPIQCAQCHDHPVERWTQGDFESFAAAFAQVRMVPVDRREGVYRVEDTDRIDRRLLRDDLGAAMARATPRALDGTDLAPPEGSDATRRDRLAGWMTAPDNPWAARSFVNRVWARYLGMGLVEPVDDLGETAQPVLAPLLDDLAARFVAAGWSVRAVERGVLLSRAYRVAAAPLEGDVAAARWSRFAARPMDEDALVGALFTVLDAERRAARLPPRAAAALELRVRRAVSLAFDEDAEANPTRSDATVQQILLLMNAELIDRGTSAGAPSSVLAGLDAREAEDDRRVIDALFVRVLGRPATPADHELARAFVAASPSRDEALEDLFWALLNGSAFVTVL